LDVLISKAFHKSETTTHTARHRMSPAVASLTLPACRRTRGVSCLDVVPQ